MLNIYRRRVDRIVDVATLAVASGRHAILGWSSPSMDTYDPSGHSRTSAGLLRTESISDERGNDGVGWAALTHDPSLS
ncbi:hypothetical protein EVAR_75469_1 [Eumeta japonica]|uniref:Uncharacterized protein n=1 Tax=Eumeta variegata TaxID=151549 RepID=A0A4C1TML5_EUMVA|nr:hypothetical protein EVAR_75469_1 [Eumeta japonica]